MKGMFYALPVYNIKAKALYQQRVKHHFFISLTFIRNMEEQGILKN